MNATPDDSLPIPAAIERAAAAWFRRRDAGLSPDAQREFAAWLAADPRHRVAYARLDTLWAMLDRVAVDDLPSVSAARGPRRFWPAVAFAAAAAVVLAFLGWRDAGISRAQERTVVTGRGELERVELSDGSQVTLNTASTVAIRLGARERVVDLAAGEAAFAVAPDPARPFVVRVGSVHVQAVGTAFAIRRRDEAVEVLVTEGRVRVFDGASGRNLLAAGAPAGDAVLSAQQRAVVAAGSGRAEVSAVAPDAAARALAWQHKQLEFSEERLDRIAAEFNRYNRVQIVVADRELAAQTFGGKFPADEPAALVSVLEKTFRIAVERRGDTFVLRAPATRDAGR